MFRIAYQTPALQGIFETTKDCRFRVMPPMTISHTFYSNVQVKPIWDELGYRMDPREGIMAFPEDLSEEELLLGITRKKEDQTLISLN